MSSIPKHKRRHHGLAYHELYKTWIGMKERCYNQHSLNYPNYGGRGIRVCDRWRSSFPNFLKDIGEKPSKLHTIDRIDNDGNYEPDNVEWATHSEQGFNRRKLSNNTSGYTGVTLDKKTGRWKARICIDYKEYYLGYFVSPVEAYETYAIKREALGY